MKSITIYDVSIMPAKLAIVIRGESFRYIPVPSRKLPEELINLQRSASRTHVQMLQVLCATRPSASWSCALHLLTYPASAIEMPDGGGALFVLLFEPAN